MPTTTSPSLHTSDQPTYAPLNIGPPALWVARFGLPNGAGLLDSGADDHAEYASFDILGLHPIDQLVIDTHSDTQDEFDRLETWHRKPWVNHRGQAIDRQAWVRLSKQLKIPLALTFCTLSYEVGAERLGADPQPTPHPSPRIWAVRYPAIYVWSRRQRRGVVIGQSQLEVDRLVEALSEPLREERSSGEHPGVHMDHNPWLYRGNTLLNRTLTPHTPWTSYQDNIERIHQHLLDGEVYQLNLTTRLDSTLNEGVTSAEIFTRLREANSGQFSALLRIDEARSIISMSPERLVKWGYSTDEDQEDEDQDQDDSIIRFIETAPIKGTRPRHHDEVADQRERDQLIASKKDQAEHVMILDLERNDLVKICTVGTVKVIVNRELRSYSTVHHLVSVIRGQLPDTINLAEILKAIFPGGSVTGAPKRRAVQLIREIEASPRGIYCGAIGYLDPIDGGDLNIPIRTAILHGDTLTYHAGGGIVADSTAQAEWEELWVKTRGMLKGLGVKD